VGRAEEQTVEADVAGGVSGAGGAGGTLPTAPLGRSGVRVIRLMFGGAPIGGLFAAVAEDAALATLEAA
jgi:hypothetical protein